MSHIQVYIYKCHCHCSVNIKSVCNLCLFLPITLSDLKLTADRALVSALSKVGRASDWCREGSSVMTSLKPCRRALGVVKRIKRGSSSN
jgi:hypothetical protein